MHSTTISQQEEQLSYNNSSNKKLNKQAQAK